MRPFPYADTTLLQSTNYWKNAQQQGLPFTLNPAVLYRGYTVNVLQNGFCVMSQFFLAGQLKRVMTGGTDRELRDIVLNFMIAGRDTTACALPRAPLYHVLTVLGGAAAYFPSQFSTVRVATFGGASRWSAFWSSPWLSHALMRRSFFTKLLAAPVLDGCPACPR